MMLSISFLFLPHFASHGPTYLIGEISKIIQLVIK